MGGDSKLHISWSHWHTKSIVWIWIEQCNRKMPGIQNLGYLLIAQMTIKKTLFEKAICWLRQLSLHGHYPTDTEMVNKKLTIRHTASKNVIGYFPCRAQLPASQLGHPYVTNCCDAFLWRTFQVMRVLLLICPWRATLVSCHIQYIPKVFCVGVFEVKSL